MNKNSDLLLLPFHSIVQPYIDNGDLLFCHCLKTTKLFTQMFIKVGTTLADNSADAGYRLQDLQRLSEQGPAERQTNLATHYGKGNAVLPRDHSQARKETPACIFAGMEQVLFLTAR